MSRSPAAVGTGEQRVRRLRARKQRAVNQIEPKWALYRLGCYHAGLYGYFPQWVEDGLDRAEAKDREAHWGHLGF